VAIMHAKIFVLLYLHKFLISYLSNISKEVFSELRRGKVIGFSEEKFHFIYGWREEYKENLMCNWDCAVGVVNRL
jgi:hypothetical protein